MGHLERVVARLQTPGDRAVAWLHDVLEDTPITAEELRERGIPESVIAAVDALTRRTGQEPAAYYRRVRANPVARRVKLADIADNSDPGRLAVLDGLTRARLQDKYREARARLGASEAE